MKKRPIIICLLVAILGSVIFWLQSNYIITGWLKGEAFYQGRPTSYWRNELRNWQGCVYPISGFVDLTQPSGFMRQFSPPQKMISWLIPQKGTYSMEPPLLDGDPDAITILQALKNDFTEEKELQILVGVGIKRIQTDWKNRPRFTIEDLIRHSE